MYETLTTADQTSGSNAVMEGSNLLTKQEPEPQLNEHLPIQLKLSVGAVNDPLEHEADAMADRVMRMPEPSFIQRKGQVPDYDEDDEHVRLKPVEGNAPFIQRKSPTWNNEYDDERVHRKPLSTQITPFIQKKGSEGGAASDAVSSKIQSTRGGGSPMGSDTLSFMESRFGSDFSNVRIHTGTDASDLSRELNAQAFAVGSDIYFNSGKYAPESDSGKHLLAHELTHVLQQSGSVERKIQRQVTQGPPFTLTTDWDIQFIRNKPAPAEMNAAPSSVLTPGGLSMLNLITNSFRTMPGMEAELEGDASSEGTEEYNMALSIRRAQYIGRILGIGRISDVPGRTHTCQRIEDGIYACGETNARATVNPADRRVRVSMFTRPSPTVPHLPSVTGGTPTIGGGQAPAPQTPAGQTGGQPAPQQGPQGTAEGNQFSLQGAYGRTWHRYPWGSTSSDPAREAVVQFSAAVTHQFASARADHVELQGLVQLQISRTTGVVSLAGGGQLSYVVPFGDDHFQWSIFLQLLAGSPFNPQASFQFQPSIGTQLVVTPDLSNRWFQFGAQASGGLTLQTNGSQSADYGGVVMIQIVR